MIIPVQVEKDDLLFVFQSPIPRMHVQCATCSRNYAGCAADGGCDENQGLGDPENGLFKSTTHPLRPMGHVQKQKSTVSGWGKSKSPSGRSGPTLCALPLSYSPSPHNLKSPEKEQKGGKLPGLVRNSARPTSHGTLAPCWDGHLLKF